ncbi:lamin-A-like isoform X2 [Anoplopoma fimbria]|uniref:lamin-A-like isoform X2 n=1 Tax=Anoplopoma fimbria TaxID=229290 RepID=UPI0023EACD6B|nr:lamin-A-like isoform X2 [Anoplopoma fimbria]
MKLLLNRNKEWQQKLHEEKTRREAAEREVETLKKVQHSRCPLTANHSPLQENSSSANHSPQQENSSSANQNSTTGPGIVIEVDQRGKYIRLRNKSHEDRPLGGWRLEMQVSRRNISYTFDKSYKLKSGETVTMSGPGCDTLSSSSELWWKDFRTFNSADKLKFTLIDNTESRHELTYTIFA